MAKTAVVSKRNMRGQTRYCVMTDGNKRARGFGGRGSTKRMMGCFKEKSKAVGRAVKLVGKSHVKGA